MKSIASADNSNFKRWLRLVEAPREVRAQRKTLAEGIHLAEAIHGSGYAVEAVLVRKGTQRPEVHGWIQSFVAGGAAAFELTAGLFDRLSPVERGSGLLLLIPVPEPQPLTGGDALFLDGVQDPGNAGALLRVAAAAGVPYILAAPGTVGLWSPKVLRGAQGAHFRLRILEEMGAPEARSVLPMPWIGASAHTGTSLWDADLTSKSIGLMVGAEGAGLSPSAAAACDRHIRIPVASGVESLNVAAAAAICLFERRRQAEALHVSRRSGA